jgi:hypothetical protein
MLNVADGGRMRERQIERKEGIGFLRFWGRRESVMHVLICFSGALFLFNDASLSRGVHRELERRAI